MAQFMGLTKTVLRNLFSKPVTTSYPAVPREYPERTRGHIEIQIEDCILCGLCMRSCPPGAIQVNRGTGAWTINRFDCIQCGYCVEKCPKKCLSIVPGYTAPEEKKQITSVVKPAAEESAKSAAAAKAPVKAKAATKAE